MKTKLIVPSLCAFAALAFTACDKKSDSSANGGGDNSAAANPIGTPGGVKLETALPPELIEGTPKPMNVPKLEPAPTKPPEFYVPAGTVLLSKGKKVTSSDADPIIGKLDLITDGEKDAGEGYFVELQDGLQWIQIDLEQSVPLYAIWVWHFHSQKRAYNAVIAQISDDPEFKTGVTTVYNNDYAGIANGKMGKATDNPYVETRFGKIINAKGTKGRYVRLYSSGNTSSEMNHYVEVEVYGTGTASAPAKAPDATPAPATPAPATPAPATPAPATPAPAPAAPAPEPAPATPEPK